MAALAALAVTGLAACGARKVHVPPAGIAVAPQRFDSNSERLYLTGTSSRGTRMIPHGVGPMPGGGNHTMMRGDSCAGCHGADRQGGRLAMRLGPVTPPLTPAALAGGHDGRDDGHAHAAYTAATLARAITEGVGPGGYPLDPAMPRWSMSEADLANLVAYLMDGAPADH
jgi:hypothetical protein